MSAKTNLYEILNVSNKASFEELRKAYQQLILQFHPDKNQSSLDNSSSNVKFIEIDEAWKILRDPEKRQQYDAELGQAKFDDKPIVHETLHKSDFEFDNDSETYFHDCRCGGVYVLPEDFDEMENIYIACDECSLVIEVEKNKIN